MHRSHFADRVRAFLLAAALVSALICPQALAADAAGSGGCAHGHTLTTCHGGKSVCAVCGETVGIRAAQYTGWLTVEGTADRMYFLSGEHVTGWQQLDGGDTKGLQIGNFLNQAQIGATQVGFDP